MIKVLEKYSQWIENFSGERFIVEGFRGGGDVLLYSFTEERSITVNKEDVMQFYHRDNDDLKPGDKVLVKSKEQINEVLNIRTSRGRDVNFPATWDSAMFETCGDILIIQKVVEKYKGRYLLEDKNGNSVPYYYDAEMIEYMPETIRRF